MEIINETILNLFLLFFIYSFLGWCLESFYRFLYYKKLINSGFLSGPILPIFGVSAIGAVLFWGWTGQNLFITLVLGVLLINILEYIVSVFLEKLIGLRLWDYSNLKFNFKGRISLESSIIWFVLLYLLLIFIHPFFSFYVFKISILYKWGLLIILLMFLLIDLFLTILELLGLKKLLRMNLSNIDDYLKKKKTTEYRLLRVFPKFYNTLLESLKKRKRGK